MDVLYARLLQWQTPTFCITLFYRNMGPSSRLQPFPIKPVCTAIPTKPVCTAIHECPYLHLAVSFIQIIDGQSETELHKLICFSSYQHMATPITNIINVVSALICKLYNMTSKFHWWGLPTLDRVQNAGAPNTWPCSKCWSSQHLTVFKMLGLPSQQPSQKGIYVGSSTQDTSNGINGPSSRISQR
jgi:hypothetical protein